MMICAIRTFTHCKKNIITPLHLLRKLVFIALINEIGLKIDRDKMTILKFKKQGRPTLFIKKMD